MAKGETVHVIRKPKVDKLKPAQLAGLDLQRAFDQHTVQDQPSGVGAVRRGGS